VNGAETNTLGVEASNPLPIKLGSLTGARVCRGPPWSFNERTRKLAEECRGTREGGGRDPCQLRGVEEGAPRHVKES
jgi:hypothetical protein